MDLTTNLKMDMTKQKWMITWHDEMSVGIPEIDEDHKKFIRLVNELNQAIAGRMDSTEIKQRLQLIVEDATRHFDHEEKLFKEWQYPDAAGHANIHNQVIAALQDIQEKFISYGLDNEWIEVGLRIKDALVNHILIEDIKYADFYRKSGMPEIPE